MEVYKTQFKENIQSLIEQGLIHEAKNMVDEYESIVKDEIDIYSIKGVIAMMEGNIDEAEDLVIEGLNIEPDNFDLLYNIAIIFKEKGYIEGSLYFFKRTFQQLKDNLYEKELLNNIGDMQKKLNQLNQNRYETFKEDKVLVSIVLLAFNKLEYTKMCVESIYKYSENVDFELIMVDNGSSDKTKEYFKWLPNKKKIYIKENIGPVNGFNRGMKEAEGKYVASVCNDFIFTSNWLKNLVICMESDENIGYVSPGASLISNLQQINGEYSNISEMQKFAKKYNRTDPKKWEERVRLLPNVLFIRRKILDFVGYYDSRFYFGEFADDDISFRIRRAGYKLMYAGDTFTYHAGSITTGEAQKENNSLEVSRKLFYDKVGLDAWDDVYYDINLINTIKYEQKESNSKVNLLGIDPKCGATMLQIKNKFRRFGQNNVSIDSYANDYKYYTDLKTICKEVFCGDYKDISRRFSNKKYDCIVIGESAQFYNDFWEIIDELKNLLKENGSIIFAIDNTMNYIYLYKMLLEIDTGYNSDGILKFFEMDKLEYKIEKVGMKLEDKKLELLNISQSNKTTIDNLTKLFPENYREAIANKISVNRYLVSITKS